MTTFSSTPLATEVTTEHALLNVLQLEVKARSAQSLDELQFIALNETRLLLSYDQSLLWDAQSGKLVGASGLVDIDANAPFCTWANGVFKGISQTDKAQRIHTIDPTQLAFDDAARFADYFSARLIWLPIQNANGDLIASLLLSKEQELNLREKKLLSFLLNAYGHAWQSFIRQRRHFFKNKSWRWWAVGGSMLAGLLCIPIQQSVIAPAEIVPQQPNILRAPIKGIVRELTVRPNDTVVAGQVVARLDAKELQQQLETARQTYAISRAELRMAQQQSFIDEQRKAALAVLEGRQVQAQLDMTYLQQQLTRTEIVAPYDGVVIFDNQGDWLGKPLALGDPIMTIADPNKTELEIRLPLQDVIELEIGSSLKLFLNSDPANSVAAELVKIAYKASPTEDGQYALQLKGRFTDSVHSLRLGKKGVAKLYGEYTTLFYYLFRKPLSELRIWLAW
uniref:Uncharacterized protein n=1 Tax=Marinomonas sp. (strain MWYL1) TaxID=400668 RepID=A6VS11_MARMS